MTRRTNARVAGFTYLFYLAVGITSMVLSNRAIGGEGIAAKLASIAQHAREMRVLVVLTLLTSLSALVLGVTLYAITREQDPDLAMLGLTGRVIEGVNGATSMAWLGVIASFLLVLGLPAQFFGLITGGFFTGPIGWFAWMPLLVFEVTLALWFLIKGVAMPAPR